MKYKGSCHCKSVQFEFESEKIDSALQCNCSICIRKNAIMSKFSVEPEYFKLIQGKEALSTYHWND
ncbi:MAG: GFA family protein, partial [Kangiellaceae bacterium]|nr:GFA family protein [Kangiellaceae bacterium]